MSYSSTETPPSTPLISVEVICAIGMAQAVQKVLFKMPMMQ